MEVGDEYLGITGDCYRKIQSILNNSSDEFYDFLTSDFNDSEVNAILRRFTYDSKEDFYYIAEETTDFDLLGGKYSDFLTTMEVIGDETGVDCGWQGILMISSTQGSAGF